MTGIASGNVMSLDMAQTAKAVKDTNAEIADIIGIKRAARTTCVKPAGTTSLVLGTSSGIHAWHNDYYIRRMRVGKAESIYSYLYLHHPELVEDEHFRPHDTAVISVPQRAPEGAILRTESPLETLERVKKVSQSWIDTGHRTGQNGHNVSCTISLRDDQWRDVGNWMWKNREHYNGIAVLPYNGGTYQQAPFEDCSKETYDAMISSLEKVDLTKVIEVNDNTDLTGEIACAGPQGCEVV